MPFNRTMTALAGAAALVAVTGCSLVPNPGSQRPTRASAPALGGYLIGDPIGGTPARAERLRRAGIVPLGGGAVGDYVDRQEAQLRRQLAGTGIEVIRHSNTLIVRMPSSVAFDVNQSAIRPQTQSVLADIARTLSGYSQTFVDVFGHTDSEGAAGPNQALSVRRAGSVSSYLRSKGVAVARIASRGFGESAPLVSPDDTETKRAANRRVEIKLVPYRR